jgi:hypothetical protein
MNRWQVPVGLVTLLAAAIIMALYEFSILETQPAISVALLLAVIGGSALGSARTPRPVSK